jgi:CDP-diacylglycerol---glycerol-3-phosphate 3-phosphatidyltransferase
MTLSVNATTVSAIALRGIMAHSAVADEEVVVLLRSLPNLLGIFRILATPILVWLVLQNTSFGYYGAIILLLLMAASDIADGPLARRLGVVSPLGVFLDTISDKIFVAGALLPMVEVELLSSWIALVVIVRDFAVSGLRSFAAAEGVVISARQWGKQKLVITVVAIVWRLLAAAYLGADAPAFQVPPGDLSGLELLLAWGFSIWPIPMALMLAWTIFSGAEYFWKAWPLLGDKLVPEPKPAAAPPQNPSLK